MSATLHSRSSCHAEATSDVVCLVADETLSDDDTGDAEVYTVIFVHTDGGAQSVASTDWIMQTAPVFQHCGQTELNSVLTLPIETGASVKTSEKRANR